MARFARVVVPEIPHHVTARGNRREPIFFEDGDHDVYCDMLAEQTRKAGVVVWACCLMPNHVHLILTPGDEAGLGRAVGECHRRYTAFVNARARWTGHLFDGRYASVAMDETHLIAAARHVSLNPVRAGLVASADDWAWSSVRAHRAGVNDGLVEVRPVLDRVEDFAALVSADPEPEARHKGEVQALRASEAPAARWARAIS
jgi:putative transposase